MASHRVIMQVQANEFQANVLQYMDNGDINIENYLKENFMVIHDWISKQEESAINEQTSKIADVFVTSAGAIKKLTSDDNVNIMQGSLEIIGSVVSLASGANSIYATAIIKILGKVLLESGSTQPDIVTQLHKIVHAELVKFHQRLLDERFSGLKLRISNMMRNLNDLTRRDQVPQNAENIPDELLQFIGEVGNGFTRTLSKSSEPEDVNDVVKSMVVYTYAQTCSQSLLGAMLCKYRELRLDTTYVNNMIATLKEHARENLSFLSDERYLNMEGMLDDGKLYKIRALRQNTLAYRVVEMFRVAMNMTKMKTFKEIQTKTSATLCEKPILKVDGYPKPHEWGDHHYIQFINETDFPVKVVSGIAGYCINNLKFTTNISPRSSYEREITKTRWIFSAGGYFIIYLDGSLQSDEDRFEGNHRVMEFSLSNPLLGYRKIKLMDSRDNFSDNLGKRCWEAMDRMDMTPTYWVHNMTNFMATGSFIGGGKHRCSTWLYIIQDVSPNS